MSACFLLDDELQPDLMQCAQFFPCSWEVCELSLKIPYWLRTCTVCCSTEIGDALLLSFECLCEVTTKWYSLRLCCQLRHQHGRFWVEPQMSLSQGETLIRVHWERHLLMDIFSYCSYSTAEHSAWYLQFCGVWSHNSKTGRGMSRSAVVKTSYPGNTSGQY